jgi:hypothetical protein
LKAMGKELWNKYYRDRYHWRKEHPTRK